MSVNNRVLLRLLLGKGAVLFLAANQRFVGLDHAVLPADWPDVLRRHRFANAMAQKPRRR